MGSDLTYAVVGGILENILGGFDARDAQKKKEAEDAAKRAEKEAENLFTNSNNLVAHLSHKDNRGAAVSFIHGTAVPNSPASMVYNSLDAYQQMQISTNAMGHLPDQLQEVLTQAATNVEAARSLAQDQTILQMFSTSPMAMAQLSAYAAKPLSAQEQAIIDGAPKSADIPVQLAYYNSQKVIYPTGTPAGDYLDSVITNLGAIKPEREYTSISETVKGIEDSIRNELTDAKDGEREPSLVPLLSQIRALKANIASFAIDPEYAEGEGDRLEDNYAAKYQFEFFPKAVNEYVALERLEQQIVSGVYGDDLEQMAETDWLNVLQTMVKEVNEMNVGTGSGGLRAKSTDAADKINTLKSGGFNIQDYLNKGDEESLEIVSKYEQLLNFSTSMEEVARNEKVFTSGTGDNERQTTFDMDEKNPLEALAEMNAIPNVGEFYRGLPDTGPGSKVEFLNRAEEMISLILTGSSGGEDNESKEARPDLAIDQFANHLFDEIPGFADMVKNRGFPMAGETTTGMKTTNYEQPADTNTFAVNARYSFTATDSVQKVAAAYGKTPQAMFLTNSVAYALVKPGEAQPLKAFDAVNTLQQSGIFTMEPGVAMTPKQANSVVLTLARNGQFDRGTQVDIIAASILDPKLPEGIQPAMFSTGFTLAQLNSVIRTTLGHDVNFEDVSKAITNHTTFVTQAEEVEKLLLEAGVGSAFTDNLTVKILDVFGMKDSVIATIGSNIQAFAFNDNDALFSAADMRVEQGQSAELQKAKIIEMANDFVKTNFRANQAKLGSALVTLAYNYAKTMDPSGRISERDFQAALVAVQGDGTAGVGARLALVRDIIRKSRNELVYNQKVFRIKSTGTGNNIRYRLSKPHLQRMQALTHYRPLLRASRGMEDVQRYRSILGSVDGPVFNANGGFVNANMAAQYSVDNAAAEAFFGTGQTAAGQVYSIAEANNIGVLKLGPDPNKAKDLLVGIPIFIDTRTGEIIPNSRIRQLTGQGL
tara:strand:- start:1542 stop:4511 length:2970 start_codon:yes stop_codon:yes gene_type:complete